MTERRYKETSATPPTHGVRFSERVEKYLALAWEFMLLALYVVGVYCEYLYRWIVPKPLKSLNKEIILVRP